MRNIARHEHAFEVSLAGISHALLHCARSFGESLPDEGTVTVNFDDSIVTDTASEKRLAMAEVGVTMHPWVICSPKISIWKQKRKLTTAS